MKEEEKTIYYHSPTGRTGICLEGSLGLLIEMYPNGFRPATKKEILEAKLKNEIYNTGKLKEPEMS